MKRRLVSRIFTILSMGVLILDSRHGVACAAEGIDLCIRTVVPSLFPFFVLSIYLTGNISPKNAAASVLFAGFLGGYPVGAQAAAENLRTGSLTRMQANRMLMFCSQAGPAFLFGMVAHQFPEAKYAWFLWAVQLLSAATVAALSPKAEKTRQIVKEQPGISLPDAMKSAIRAMASVCGWVVLFRVIGHYVCLIPMDQTVNTLISGMLELTNGCLKLSSVNNPELRFMLAALMLNFGGICVFLQTRSVAKQLDIRYYLAGKLLQTGLSFAYGLCFLGYWQSLIPIFCLLALFRRRIPVKRSSIPTEVGV